jgi:hypothetical protein
LLDEVNTAVSGIEMIITSTQIIFSNAGIADLFTSAPVIYPNPVGDQVHIALDPARPLNLVISISDVTGRVIRQENRRLYGPQTISIHTSDLAKGFYHLVLEADGIIVQKKLLK